MSKTRIINEKFEAMLAKYGLLESVKLMTSAETEQACKEAEDVHRRASMETGLSPVVPTKETTYLVRSTNIVPKNGIMQPASQGYIGHYEIDPNLHASIINKAFAKKCQELGIEGVTSSDDIYSGRFSEEESEKLKALHTSLSEDNRFRIAYKGYRSTVHFTMNSLVANNNGGTWDKDQLIFIEPYQGHETHMSNLLPADCWASGKFPLGRGKKTGLLLTPDALILLLKKYGQDKGVMATLKNCDIRLINPGDKLKRADYVKAYLHQHGAPTYDCQSSYLVAVAQRLLLNGRQSQPIETKELMRYAEALAKDATQKQKEAEEESRDVTCGSHECSIDDTRDVNINAIQAMEASAQFLEFMLKKEINGVSLESKLDSDKLAALQQGLAEFKALPSTIQSGNLTAIIQEEKEKSEKLTELYSICMDELTEIPVDDMEQAIDEFNDKFIKEKDDETEEVAKIDPLEVAEIKSARQNNPGKEEKTKP